MAGVEIGGAQLRVAFQIEAAGAHEIQRVRDAIRQLLVTARLRRILQEAEQIRRVLDENRRLRGALKISMADNETIVVINPPEKKSQGKK